MLGKARYKSRKMLHHGKKRFRSTLSADRTAEQFCVNMDDVRPVQPFIRCSDVLKSAAERRQSAPTRGVHCSEAGQVFRPWEQGTRDHAIAAPAYAEPVFGRGPTLRQYQVDAVQRVCTVGGVHSGVVCVPCRGGKFEKFKEKINAGEIKLGDEIQVTSSMPGIASNSYKIDQKLLDKINTSDMPDKGSAFLAVNDLLKKDSLGPPFVAYANSMTIFLH